MRSYRPCTDAASLTVRVTGEATGPQAQVPEVSTRKHSSDRHVHGANGQSRSLLLVREFAGQDSLFDGKDFVQSPLVSRLRGVFGTQEGLDDLKG